MSVIPDALRSTIISSPLGDLSFTPSVDAILYYEARVYALGTSSPVLATVYLGGPPPTGPSADQTGKIKVNILRTLNALPSGNYEVRVAAIGAGGTSESTESNPFEVPVLFPLGG